MIIRLSKQQQSDLLEWSAKLTDEECLHPGYDLVISVSSIEDYAEARCGTQVLVLGDVDVTLE